MALPPGEKDRRGEPHRRLREKYTCADTHRFYPAADHVKSVPEI